MILDKCVSLLIQLLALKKKFVSSKEIIWPIKSNYTSNPEVISNVFNPYFVSIG